MSIYPVPKPQPRKKNKKPMKKKKSDPIPKNMRKAVDERDGDTCQICGNNRGYGYHHCIITGMGYKKIHKKEVIIKICDGPGSCHWKTHHSNKPGEAREYKLKAIEWSRKRYGDLIDKIMESKKISLKQVLNS